MQMQIGSALNPSFQWTSRLVSQWHQYAKIPTPSTHRPTEAMFDLMNYL